MISGLSLADIESLFVVRALQLLKRQKRLDLAAIVFVEPGAHGFKRLGDRMRSGWPFRSARCSPGCDAAREVSRGGWRCNVTRDPPVENEGWRPDLRG